MMLKFLSPMMTFVACAALLVPILDAQVIDQTVARVRLTRSEVVTQRQLRRQVEQIERHTQRALDREGRRRILDMMVSELLIGQAAARDNIRVTEEEVQTGIVQYKRSVGAAQATDDQFRLVVQNHLGITYEEFVNDIRKRLLQEKFIMERRRAVFQNLPEPTSAQILSAYNANPRDFVSPLMVRLNHIFIDTRNLGETERASARRRAENALREVRADPRGFSEVAAKNSDDHASRYRGGDIGYLLHNDTQRQMLFGRSFFDTVFAMNVGDMSGILESNVGLHIVQLTERHEARLLRLEDPIRPGTNVTVRDHIRIVLTRQAQQAAFQQAAEDVLAELRRQAEVTIFEQHLNW